MQTELYFFSGTGNSYYIAKKIAASIPNSRLISINTLDLSKEINSSAQVVGIIFPVYFLDAPNIVKKFIKKLEVATTCYVFVFANSGGTEGNARSSCTQLLRDKNITVSHSFSVVLPDNSIIFPTAPDNINPMFSKAEQKIQLAIEAIKTQVKSPLPKNNLGFTLLGYIMVRYGKSYLGFKDLKSDSDKCTSCGICTQVCPMKNIELHSGLPVFKDQCEMCFACIHYCPSKCITFRKMKARGAYQCTNPYIPVTEIMAKNKESLSYSQD